MIDKDLGLSGATTSERNGFQRLVAEVGLGRVGVVMELVDNLTRLDEVSCGRLTLGFVYYYRLQMALDTDRQVQDMVRLIFEAFRRSGSAKGVVRYFSTQGILWAQRLVSGLRPRRSFLVPWT